MSLDLRDVVNKIIIATGDDDPAPEEIAELASNLATFFDASVVLVYLGKLPLNIPPGPNQLASPQIIAAATTAIEDNGKRVLDGMAEVMTAHGIKVGSRLVIGTGNQAIKDIIEKEQADLVVLPTWGSGVANRLARVFSPSVLEDATCPVLVLKGNRWLSKSKSLRPSQQRLPSGSP
jgi:nucleotide-binding universal stress UspA family protein